MKYLLLSFFIVFINCASPTKVEEPVEEVVGVASVYYSEITDTTLVGLSCHSYVGQQFIIIYSDEIIDIFKIESYNKDNSLITLTGDWSHIIDEGDLYEFTRTLY